MEQKCDKRAATMKRLIIIAEGRTEELFINQILAPYLREKGILSIQCFKIKKTKGGLRQYAHLKKDIMKSVREKNVIVSTLIDYYALPKSFPQYIEAREISEKDKRLTFLEEAIVQDIEKDTKSYLSNLIPYIQLHEFEAFIFASIIGIESVFEGNDKVDLEGIKKLIDSYPYPEEINSGKETAPSKRLENLVWDMIKWRMVWTSFVQSALRPFWRNVPG